MTKAAFKKKKKKTLFTRKMDFSPRNCAVKCYIWIMVTKIGHFGK
jgi:hypothetical protein